MAGLCTKVHGMPENGRMATKTVMTVVDDVDGSTKDVRTVEFGFQGVTYEADLGPASLDRLAAALAPFLMVARKKGSRRDGAVRITRLPPDNSVIRAWAAANHIALPTRGRISEAIRQRYLDTH
jgi:hypothetical protein